MSLQSRLDTFITSVGTDVKNILSAMVTLTGAQTITGVKTFQSGKLLMRNAADTISAEPYSDVNAPETLSRTEYVTDPATPPSGQSVEWTPDGIALWMKNDAGTKWAIGPAVENLTIARAGAMTVAAGVSQFPIAGGTFRILSIAVRLQTAPTGAAVLVDINKNGTTIFTTQSARPSIAVSTNSATVGTPAVTDVTTGDYISVDVDQIGSTVAGSNLVVSIRMIRIA